MSSIVYSITIVARDTAHALQIAKELRENGVESSNVSAGIARTSAPVNVNGQSAFKAGKGDNEKLFVSKYGKTRITPNLQAQAGLIGSPNHPEERDAMFAKLISLMDAGVLVRNLAGAIKRIGDNTPESFDSGEGNGATLDIDSLDIEEGV